MNVFTVVCGAKPFSQGMFTFGAIVCQCLGFTHPHSQSIIFFFFFFHSSEVLEKTDTCKCASLNVSSVRLGHWILIADRIYVHGQKFVLGRLRVNIRSITVDPRSLEFPRETKMVRVSGGSRWLIVSDWKNGVDGDGRVIWGFVLIGAELAELALIREKLSKKWQQNSL